MNEADVSKVKKLAARLGVRDSDIIRFAVKSALARLGPLHDSRITGRHLVPVFVEYGSELLQFFDFDAARLEAIINGGAPADGRVDHDDVALLALTGTQEPYAALRLSELDRTERRDQTRGELSESLRNYLYSKYLYHHAADLDEEGQPIRVAVGLERRKAVEG